MKKRTKISLVLSSAAAILLAGSIMAGGTYALFTSESKVNIAVNSGKVNVEASIEDLTAYTPKLIKSDGSSIEESDNIATNTTFGNGGTVVLNSGLLTLDKMTPGDKVNFNIKIKNNSNVKVMYRTKILLTEDDGLYGALNFKIGSYTGTTITKWEGLSVGSEDVTLPCEIELPTTAGNDYQNKTVKFSVIVEAVQGNTKVVDAINASDLLSKYGDDGMNMPTGLNMTVTSGNVDITLNDEEAYIYFTQVFNQTKAYEARKKALNDGTVQRYDGEYSGDLNIWWYYNVSVKLNCDVDLQSQIVKPFTAYRSFDGQSHTIKNAWVYGEGNNVGLFGEYSITNVTLDNIHVIAIGKDGGVGVVSGYNNRGITNVNVKNSSVVGGKYAGVIVGNCYTDIKNCSIESCNVTGQYKVGGIAGYLCSEGSERKIENNSLKNIKIKGENIWSGKTDFIIGKVVGQWNSFKTGDVCKNNTLNNVTGADNNIGEVLNNGGAVDQSE